MQQCILNQKPVLELQLAVYYKTGNASPYVSQSDHVSHGCGSHNHVSVMVPCLVADHVWWAGLSVAEGCFTLLKATAR